MSPSTTDRITDRIEKTIVLRVSRSRVWRALTDPVELGSWFGVKVEETTFAPGRRARGAVTHPGYEHLIWDITVERMEPERLFSWRWHPLDTETDVDYSEEITTLVEFALEDVAGGTRLTVVESGFDRVPASHREKVYLRNEGGWEAQVKAIERHVS